MGTSTYDPFQRVLDCRSGEELHASSLLRCQIPGHRPTSGPIVAVRALSDQADDVQFDAHKKQAARMLSGGLASSADYTSRSRSWSWSTRRGRGTLGDPRHRRPVVLESRSALERILSRIH